MDSTDVFKPRVRGLVELAGVVVVGLFGVILGLLVASSALERGKFSVAAVAGMALFVVPSLGLLLGPVLYFVRSTVTVTDGFIAKRYPFGFVRTCRIGSLEIDSYSMDFTETRSFLLGKREVHRFGDASGKVRFKLGTNWWHVEEILASARSRAGVERRPSPASAGARPGDADSRVTPPEPDSQRPLPAAHDKRTSWWSENGPGVGLVAALVADAAVGEWLGWISGAPRLGIGFLNFSIQSMFVGSALLAVAVFVVGVVLLFFDALITRLRTGRWSRDGRAKVRART